MLKELLDVVGVKDKDDPSRDCETFMDNGKRKKKRSRLERFWDGVKSREMEEKIDPLKEPPLIRLICGEEDDEF